MRILVLAALLGSGLYAQTPADKPSEPVLSPQAAAPALAPPAAASPNPARLDRTRELLRHLIAPNDSGYVMLPGIVPSNIFGRRKLVLTRTCSIPLLDVAPEGGFHGDPKFVLPGPETPTNPDHMPVAQGSPPCAPSKP